jgi:uncharacterized membrane protein
VSDDVLARSARRLSLRRARLHEQVLESLWFLPLCCAIGAWILARVALHVDITADAAADATGLSASRDAFGAVAGAVAAAMLTFLGVVFSTTLVAVQLAASQYSPRIVRVFVRSRLTQATLGVFLATFVFALASLFGVEASNKEFVPELTLVCLFTLVAATVLMFVAYIHGMVRLLRVQYLLRTTAQSSHDALDHAFPDADAYHLAKCPEPSAEPRLVRNRSTTNRRHRGTRRVVQAVDVGGLADAAAARGCWVEMRIAVGAHAGPGVVAAVHGNGLNVLTEEEILHHLLFGSERTLVQDPAFGLRQLVDTASRALSPAINDPTTGVQALHLIVDLLERVADRPDPTGWYCDPGGVVRVRLVEDSFERLARLGLTEILRYGADAPQVTRSLLAAYDELQELVTDDRRPFLDELRAQCLDQLDLAMPPPFKTEARQPDRDGMG